MIQLQRVRDATVIPSSFRGATPRNRLVKLMQLAQQQIAAGEPVKLKVDSKWGVTKDQLLAESLQKCAYCETPTSVVAFGDVEHYRPKSVYWWLAYVYDNYLASCAVCNQKFKGARFEHDGPRWLAPAITAHTTEAEMKTMAKELIPDPLNAAAVTAFEAAHRAEKPWIVNPYIDDPDEVFAWQVIAGIQEVEVVPATGVADADRYVDAAERIYGINRPELKRLRFKHYNMYRTFRLTADAAGVPAEIRDMNLEMIELLQAAESQYAAMIRYFEAQHAAGH